MIKSYDPGLEQGAENALLAVKEIDTPTKTLPTATNLRCNREAPLDDALNRAAIPVS